MIHQAFSFMKKLTPRYKKWLIRRCRKPRKATPRLPTTRRIVTGWFGTHQEELTVRNAPVIPPTALDFSTNYSDTLEFFANWREKFLSVKPGSVWVRRSSKPGRRARMKGYVDYSAISDISTAASVVLVFPT